MKDTVDILRRIGVIGFTWVLWFILKDAHISGYIQYFLNNFCIFKLSYNDIAPLYTIFNVKGGIAAFIILVIYSLIFPAPFATINTEFFGENEDDAKRLLMVLFAILIFTFGFLLRDKIPFWDYIGATGTFMLFGATGKLLYDLVAYIGCILFVVVGIISILATLYAIFAMHEGVLLSIAMGIFIVIAYILVIGAILAGIQIFAYAPVAIAIFIVIVSMYCRGDLNLWSIVEFGYIFPTFGFAIFLEPPKEEQDQRRSDSLWQ